MNVEIPEVCLLVLVGITGAGKSTFAARHFHPGEVLSSEACRGLVGDDAYDASAHGDAFDVLRCVTGKRLARGRLTVIDDPTSIHASARRALVEVAREHDCMAVAVVLDTNPGAAALASELRGDPVPRSRIVHEQYEELLHGLRELKREGFARVYVLDSPEHLEAARVIRRPLASDKRHEHGPFDIIGDVHGCREELVELLGRLGYAVAGDRRNPSVHAPEGRKAVFLGDLVDRGPDSPGVLRIVMAMVREGQALCVPGNHEIKLQRHLRGRTVRLTHGLGETVAQLAHEPEGFGEEVARFIEGMVSHYVLDGGRLVVAHAGLPEAYHGRISNRVRTFCLYGETTGEIDEFGLPLRYDWAADYRGNRVVVYGHTPVPRAEWVNGTVCIDTGCVFGGQLTALRYPERELVHVEAHAVHYAAAQGEERKRPQRPESVLEIADVIGRRELETRIHRPIAIAEPAASAALEVMSREAIDPRWLVVLPPMMAPCRAAPAEGASRREPGSGAPRRAPGWEPWLERPEQAFEYYARHGVERVVCEAKLGGARAIAIVARDVAAAERRFAVGDGKQGVVYGRTGRPLLVDPKVERGVVARVAAAFERRGLWSRLATDWVVLDAQLLQGPADGLPQASELAAGTAALAAVAASLDAARARGVDVRALRRHFAERTDTLARHTAAWQDAAAGQRAGSRLAPLHGGVAGEHGLPRLAPFQILAFHGHTGFDRGHAWHMDVLGELANGDSGLRAIDHRVVDLASVESRVRAHAWWEQLCACGHEGIVVKPDPCIVRGPRGLVQPALKCRGVPALRRVYGPDWPHAGVQGEAAAALERVRGTSRKLAIRQFALGVEALSRWVAGEPLWRVHECVFGVLALASEDGDSGR